MIGDTAAKFYSLALADRQNSTSVSYARLKEVDHQITHENHILVTRFIQETQYARACTVALLRHTTRKCASFFSRLTPIVTVYILFPAVWHGNSAHADFENTNFTTNVLQGF